MPDYKELLKRYEQEELNGMTNPASHSVRIMFVKWLEQQAAEQLLALDAAKVCRVINHFYIEGVCSQCGSEEPPRR